MNYLFSTTIVYNADLAKYRVYEFKLHPGKYQAQLATMHYGWNDVKEVTFWKEGNKWIVQPHTKGAIYIAEAIAKDLDRLRNRG